MSFPAGHKLAHYEIVEPIGKGGMGEVYRAKDGKLGRDVAIKVLPDEFAEDEERLRRFQREAKVLASLNHPNIASIYGLEQSGEAHYLVLELVPGETLAERIARGPIPVGEALEIAGKIAEALEEAHERGIVHRDLKPANVKLTEDGKVKVLDFGLAKAFVEEGPEGDAATSMSPTITRDATRVGVILGTAAYMSPEQAKGKRVDKRTDIFAFGAVLYEILTAKKAFPGDDVSEVLAAVIKLEPDWTALPKSLPGRLEELLPLCLNKDPRRRLRDIGDARLFLSDEAQTGAGGARDAPRKSGPSRFWRWMVASAGLGVLLGVAATAFFSRSESASMRDRVLRYSIPLVEGGLTFDFELSPDGRHVAFNAAAGELMQIYRRSLDSLALQPLPDSVFANGLFWSPDSRYVAFFAYEKMWRVPVGGGPAEQICDVPGLLGPRGTWGRRGVIVYAPSSKYEPGPLRRVAESGGESSVLTMTEPGEAHRYPSFLPDGNHFLYTSFGGAEPGVYLASLDEPAGRRLLADQTSVDLALDPTGEDISHLLFIRSGALMAQAFDLNQLELLGEPQVLLEDAPNQDDGAAAVSVSEDGVLVYLAGRNRLAHSRYSWFDWSGNVLSHETGHGPSSFVSLSPDDNLMVVPRRPPGVWSTDLYLRDVARGVDERLTFDDTVDVSSNAVWSPTGDSILFSANPVQTFDIYRKVVRSAEPPELFLETSNPAYVTDWSRDGRLVLYTDVHPETQADLWYVPVESTDARELRAGEPVPFLRTQFLESSGQLSPDGNWIAYITDESGDVELYVRSFPEGGAKRKISNGWTQEPRWSLDGRELFYFTGPESKMTLMRVEMTRALLASSAGGPVIEFSQPEALFEVRVNGFHPATGTFFYAVSSDGKRFLINHVDNEDEPVLNVVVNWQRAFGLSEKR